MQLPVGRRNAICVVALAVSAGVLAGSATAAPTPCTAKSCVITVRSDVSTLRAVPTEVSSSATNSAAAPTTSNPARGTLNKQAKAVDVVSCGGYHPVDQMSLQFFLGATGPLGNVYYKVTDTVKNVAPDRVQFCLAARYSFKTMSGKARAITLPDGLSGFVGLLPLCTKAQISQPASSDPCMVGKPRRASDRANTVITVQVPAIGGDPWGRA